MEIIVNEIKIGELTTFEISEVRCVPKIKTICEFDHYSPQMRLPFPDRFFSKTFQLSKFHMVFSIITDSSHKQLLLF